MKLILSFAKIPAESVFLFQISIANWSLVRFPLSCMMDMFWLKHWEFYVHVEVCQQAFENLTCTFSLLVVSFYKECKFWESWLGAGCALGLYSPITVSCMLLVTVSLALVIFGYQKEYAANAIHQSAWTSQVQELLSFKGLSRLSGGSSKSHLDACPYYLRFPNGFCDADPKLVKYAWGKK